MPSPTHPSNTKTERRYNCARCGDTGIVPVDLDTDRLPASGPCTDCKQYCPVCRDYKPKTGHTCKLS